MSYNSYANPIGTRAIISYINYMIIAINVLPYFASTVPLIVGAAIYGSIINSRDEFRFQSQEDKPI